MKSSLDQEKICNEQHGMMHHRKDMQIAKGEIVYWVKGNIEQTIKMQEMHFKLDEKNLVY